MRDRSARLAAEIGAEAIAARIVVRVEFGTTVGLGDVTIGHCGDLWVLTSPHARQMNHDVFVADCVVLRGGVEKVDDAMLR